MPHYTDIVLRGNERQGVREWVDCIRAGQECWVKAAHADCQHTAMYWLELADLHYEDADRTARAYGIDSDPTDYI